MIDYLIEATDTHGELIKRKILASSEKEAKEMFLTSCGWKFPDKKFEKISIVANDIKRRLGRNF